MDVVKYLVQKFPGMVGLNLAATEKQDFSQKGQFVREYTGYTPLMLAVAGGGQNLECVKLLVASKADTQVQDTVGNNIFHIAVTHGNNDCLDYLINKLPSSSVNILDRN